MRKPFCIALWFLFLPAFLSSQEIKIGIIGDQTLAPSSGADPYDLMKKGVDTLASQQPDVVLHTGDLLESIGSDFKPMPAEKYKERFQLASSILSGLKCNWYLSAGDHDVNPPWGEDTDAIRSLFKTLYGPASKNLYYSVDVKGYHFIALSSQDYPNKDVRWGVIFDQHLSDAQVSWLQQDLDKNSHAKGIIVFLHQPLWYEWADWAPVHRLLRSHGVTAVIAGHFHYNQDEGELDGIRYLVVGATGADTKKGSPEAGDLHHVTLLMLRGRKIESLALLPLRGEKVSSFSSRRDMDRVQALQVNLDNSYTDQINSAITRMPNSKVWRECATGLTPTLALRSVGNPLDVPLLLSVTPNPGNFAPTQMSFSLTWCKAITAGVCQLGPDTLVAYSNNSAVKPLNTGTANEPLWTATLPAQTSDGKTPSQSFTLRAEFKGESGQSIHLEKLLTLSTICPTGPFPQ